MSESPQEHKPIKRHYDDETNYIKTLSILVGVIIGISGLMWVLSKFIDNKPKATPPTATATAPKKDKDSKEVKENVVRQNPYQYDHAGQNFDDKNKDNPLKSKDSSEAILGKVADKILAVTGDPDTECSMPVFDKPKQYWITECDYKNLTTKEPLHQKFSILLDRIEKIQ